MKLNIQIFKRKQREEAYKGKYLNGCKPEGTGHLEHHGTEPESLHRKKSHDVVGQIAVSLW
ncbi:hypothetical protein [Phocaeicola plebeius]|jgi:hypothetical protein|uniref:hypothetical protein n=1 Tax=Phocaeicola plebeius TaxID=310297 RepID=UPI0022E632A2|nr:hypothetical protein [Phocaeicola plebeius]